MKMSWRAAVLLLMVVLPALLLLPLPVSVYSQESGAPATATALTVMRQSIYATQTAVAQGSAVPTAVPTSTPRPPAQPAPANAAPVAEVLVQGLNLRSGPGTGYAIIGNAALGQRLPVLGQWGGCAWLKVQLANGGTAWTSGAGIYSRLNVPCSRVAPAAAPTLAAPTAPRTPANVSVPTTPTPKPVTDGPTVISPSSPPPGVVLNDRDVVVFEWTSNAPLAPGQVFELIFWPAEQSYMNGRALNAASPSTAVTLKVGGALSPGAYKWGVFLATDTPYQRISFLGEGGTFTITSSDDRSDKDQPASPLRP